MLVVAVVVVIGDADGGRIGGELSLAVIFAAATAAAAAAAAVAVFVVAVSFETEKSPHGTYPNMNEHLGAVMIGGVCQ